MGSGGGVSVGVRGRRCGRTAVSRVVVLDFVGGMADTKAMGFHRIVCDGGGMVLCHGAIGGDIALGLMVEICCRVFQMELLFFDNSPVYAVMKVREVVMVKSHGVGCCATDYIRKTLVPMSLDRSTLMVVSSLIEFLTQV